MSWTWNVILSFSDEEFWEDDVEEVLESPHALDNINSWLTADKERNYGPLTDLTACATGNEAGMTAHVWGGGFKHFDIDEFINVVDRQKWQDRASVQLFIQGEEAGKFTVIDFSEEPAE